MNALAKPVLTGTRPARPHTDVAPSWRRCQFRCTHLWLPFAAVVLLAMLLRSGDQAWADWLFAHEGHRWSLQQGFLTEVVLHRIGRGLSAAAWLAVVVGWCVAQVRPALAPWRRPLAYLWLSVLLATAMVAWLKSWTSVDCPWDLARYGGQRAYLGLFAWRPAGTPGGGCFPAGHASAGYAWLALYFFFLAARPRWRWLGLGLGLGTGAAFGLAQQLRGAHFASHDLWTAAICWFMALGLYWLLWLRRPGDIAAAQAPAGSP